MGLQLKAESRIQPESPWTLPVASFWWDPNVAVNGYHGQPSSAVMEGANITTRAIASHDSPSQPQVNTSGGHV